MRIAIMGTHGVGKTTLAKSLSSKLQLPLITEVARAIAEKDGFKNTEQILFAKPERRKQYQLSVFMTQLERENSLDSFVADRSIFDSIAYSLFYGLPEKTTNHLTRIAIKHSESYDLIIYAPVPSLEVVDDGFRLTDLESQCCIDGLLLSLFAEANCSRYLLSRDRNTWLEKAMIMVQESMLGELDKEIYVSCDTLMGLFQD